MPIWAQHLLVIALVALCVLYVVRQAIKTLRSGTGKLGACCARGCSAAEKPAAPKAVFIPVESLGRPR